MPHLSAQQRRTQYDEAVALARRPRLSAGTLAADCARTDAHLATAARRAVALNLKAVARRYDRERDLSKATGVYREFCADMPRAEAIRRLTEALGRERGAYADGRNGSIVNDRSARAIVLFIKAALLAERLNRRRDAAEASFLRMARAA